MRVCHTYYVAEAILNSKIVPNTIHLSKSVEDNFQFGTTVMLAKTLG